MLDKHKILVAALEGVQKYVERYNEENSAFVSVDVGADEESDHGVINIDGGDLHGGWSLTLGEL